MRPCRKMTRLELGGGGGGIIPISVCILLRLRQAASSSVLTLQKCFCLSYKIRPIERNVECEDKRV